MMLTTICIISIKCNIEDSSTDKCTINLKKMESVRSRKDFIPKFITKGSGKYNINDKSIKNILSICFKPISSTMVMNRYLKIGSYRTLDRHRKRGNRKNTYMGKLEEKKYEAKYWYYLIKKIGNMKLSDKVLNTKYLARSVGTARNNIRNVTDTMAERMDENLLDYEDELSICIEDEDRMDEGEEEKADEGILDSDDSEIEEIVVVEEEKNEKDVIKEKKKEGRVIASEEMKGAVKNAGENSSPKITEGVGNTDNTVSEPENTLTEPASAPGKVTKGSGKRRGFLSLVLGEESAREVQKKRDAEPVEDGIYYGPNKVYSDVQGFSTPKGGKNIEGKARRSSMVKAGLAPPLAFDQIYEPNFDDDRRLSLRYTGRETVAYNDTDRVFFTSTIDGDMCVGCHRYRTIPAHPVNRDCTRTVFLTDAHFPPMVGEEGDCAGVVRVDCGTPDQVSKALVYVLQGSKVAQSMWRSVGLKVPGNQAPMPGNTTGSGQKTSLPGNNGVKRTSGTDSSKSYRKEEMVIVFSLNTFLARSGTNVYLEELERACKYLTRMLGQRFDLKFLILLTPNNFVEPEKINEVGGKAPPNVSRFNVELDNLAQLVASEQAKTGKPAPILTRGFRILQGWKEGQDDDGFDTHFSSGTLVKAGHVLFGNKKDMLLHPSLPMAVRPGAPSGALIGSALTPESEFRFIAETAGELTELLNQGEEKKRQPGAMPGLSSIATGVRRAIPDHPAPEVKEMYDALEEMAKSYGVSSLEPEPSFKKTPRIAFFGYSSAESLSDMVKNEICTITAEKNWSGSLIRVNKEEMRPTLEVAAEAVKTGEIRAGDVIILDYMSNEMLKKRKVTESPRVQTVVNPKPAKYFGNKKGKNNPVQLGMYGARTFTCDPVAIHPIKVMMRNANQMTELLNEMLKIVKLLEELEDTRIIFICPSPRYLSRCCNDPGHLPAGFSPSDYLAQVYNVSSFICTLTEMEGVFVVHPGQVFGWGKAPTSDLISNDLVHLNPEGQNVKLATVLGIVDSLREDIRLQPGRSTSIQSTSDWGEYEEELVSAAKVKPTISFVCPAFLAEDII